MDLARFERAPSTSAESRSLIPLSYRSKELAEVTGLEPVRALRGDLANRCHTVRLRLRTFSIAECQLPICAWGFVSVLCFFVSSGPSGDFDRFNVWPIGNGQSEIEDVMAEGTGLEPASDKCAVVFGTTALPFRLPFQNS